MKPSPERPQRRASDLLVVPPAVHHGPVLGAARFGERMAGGTPRVLMVNDDPVFLLLSVQALTQAGFEVSSATDGLAALQAIGLSAFDAVVLDALLPDLDGLAVCRRLRAQAEFEHLPILVMTSLDDDDSIAQAYDAGATDFLIKTTHFNLLVKRLQYMLRAAQTRLELERSKARLAQAQALARMGSCSWRARTGLLDAQFQLSPEGCAVLGFAPGARVSARRALSLVHPADRRGLVRLLRESALHRAPISADVTVTLVDGRRRVIHVDAEPERTEVHAGVHYAGVVQDFTDRREAEDRIRHLADFDPLTGLPNRRQILWRAERAVEAARERGHYLAMLLVDLDRFKLINDTLGHGMGDALLVEVARRLRECVRHVDQLHEGTLMARFARSHRQYEAVGRLGGDEFVALLPEIGSLQEAHRVAQRMLEVLRQPILLDGQECFVTASIGVCLYPNEGESVADLLRHADVAMYAVKSQGRNAALAYTPHLSRRARERLDLENALHKALERRELFLRYQPVIETTTSRIVAAEALMRWRLDGRDIMPADFIPLAEESGLIVPMTEWALEQAALQLARWQERLGFMGSVAVNLPARMLSGSDLRRRIQAVTDRFCISPSRLHLEITETALMDQVDQVVQTLGQLREIGVQISIDDFGTGYSSLAYLTRHPISELKIDRVFVQGLGDESRSKAVVAAVIAMARALDLRVVAEGVETRRQMEILQFLGCTRMQGYHFARVLDPNGFEGFFSAVHREPEGPWESSD